jgi:hypothetical protein
MKQRRIKIIMSPEKNSIIDLETGADLAGSVSDIDISVDRFVTILNPLKGMSLYLASLCQWTRGEYDWTGDKWFNQPLLPEGSRPTRKGYVQVELARRALAPCRSVHVS